MPDRSITGKVKDSKPVMSYRSVFRRLECSLLSISLLLRAHFPKLIFMRGKGVTSAEVGYSTRMGCSWTLERLIELDFCLEGC